MLNFVVDCLTRMVAGAQQRQIVSNLVNHLIPDVAILQYADDTILCLTNEIEKARNIKLVLYIDEQMSGLKINFEKSEVLMLGGDDNLA
jgi:hypothetical protein